ncbi:unnamed protein product, partial [Linum tenue]
NPNKPLLVFTLSFSILSHFLLFVAAEIQSSSSFPRPIDRSNDQSSFTRSFKVRSTSFAFSNGDKSESPDLSVLGEEGSVCMTLQLPRVVLMKLKGRLIMLQQILKTSQELSKPNR